jgi:hypothetical protein
MQGYFFEKTGIIDTGGIENV